MNPSKITKHQVAVVQIAKSSVHLDDADYRMVLRNLGKVGGERPSTKDLTQRGFEEVMAYFAGVGAKVPGDPQHWLSKSQNRGSFADARQVHLIRELAAKQPYGLDALCRWFSGNRAEDPSRLRPAEAHKLIEMLKKVVSRSPEANAS